MRVLISGSGPDVDPGGELSDEQLVEAYAAPSTPWLRVNMVSTLDGSATGSSGRSGSINNAPDHRVFTTLRRMADAILVGAGTARAEGYGAVDTPIVLVSRSAEVPPSLRGAEPGAVWMATCGASEGLAAAQELLGPDHVLVVGERSVDLARLKSELAARGLGHVLCEGGPHLLRDLLDQGVADELTTTIVPRAVAGEHPRITAGPAVDVPLRLHTLLEDDDTLLGRWFT